MSGVCAIVVTHNRRALLAECLHAVLGQTRAVDELLVVDNASTDGTAQMVREGFPQATLLELQDNEGGAGGFHEGMRIAHERGFEWLWLMDDDTIPTPTALERLLAAPAALNGLTRPLLLASKVVWTDERLHPKNLPAPRFDEASNATFLEAVARGLLLIRLASFVSILVHRDAVDRYGLPHRHYFMWGDDGEYTARILRDNPGYTVPTSLVHHKTAGLEAVHDDTTGRYYFELRNKLFQLRSGSFTGREKVHLVIGTLMGLRRWLARNRAQPRALRVFVRAVRDGVTHPAEPT